jgi:hypothetical protein
VDGKVSQLDIIRHIANSNRPDRVAQQFLEYVVARIGFFQVSYKSLCATAVEPVTVDRVVEVCEAVVVRELGKPSVRF